MRRVLSCVLIVIMLITAVGCGGKSDNKKFVGEYQKYAGTLFYGAKRQYGGSRLWTDCSVSGTQTMILNEDGTGKVIFTNINYDDNIEFGEETLKKIEKQMSDELTWEVVDEYLKVNCVGVSYYEDGKYTGVEKQTSVSYTYELKGDVLIRVDYPEETYKYKKIK